MHRCPERRHCQWQPTNPKQLACFGYPRVWIGSIVVPLNDDAFNFAKDGVFVTDEAQVHSLLLVGGSQSFFLLCKVFLHVIYDRLHILWASTCRCRITTLRLNSLYHCIVTVTIN